MIHRIIAFCDQHRYLVLLAVAIVVLFGVRSMRQTKLDAVPDLSETQVIVYARWDRSPDIMEDQVAYPLASALLGLPGVKDVRAYSDFGYSYIYVLFNEGTDLYWARSRTLEYLSTASQKLPRGVDVQLAKDVTSVGWIYQYALVDRTGNYSIDQLRAYQDWTLRYALQSVPGVAEVAPVGGFVRQYQVTANPQRLRAYNLSITALRDSIAQSNNDTGARLIEISGHETMLRGRGYLRSRADLEDIVLRATPGGATVRLRDVASVSFGPDLRRGAADLDGQGEAVGGVVIMRYGANARAVIRATQQRLDALKSSLPPGLEIVPTYDRSILIDRAVEHLKHTLTEELLIVSLVILIFLWHLRSALVPILIIPVTVILAFIPIEASGMTANIMSLGGIAVAIGALVDASVVLVEQTHKRLERWNHAGRPEPVHAVLLAAVQEVAAPSFFALLVIAVSFLPVFALEGQEGRLFRPLAYTKNFSMAIAALLSITLAPAVLRIVMGRVDEFTFRPRMLSALLNRVWIGRLHAEQDHPVSRPLMRLYRPVVRWSVAHPLLVIVLALSALGATIPAALKLGTEFMPPLDEGTLLYMPSTLPGISVGEATRVLNAQDRILASFPEVERVFGKTGRAESATDPAPFSMMETTIVLRPQEQWPHLDRWYSKRAPAWIKPLLGEVWPEHLTTEQLIYGPGGLNQALSFPGVANAWTMPIKARTDMLATGIRTPVGIKIQGASLAEIEHLGTAVEIALRKVPGTASVFAERAAAGYYLDFDLRRDQLARYGLTVDAAEDTLATAIGGDTVTTTVEGRERYSVSLRYPRDARSNLDALSSTLVATPAGAQIPISAIATLSERQGPGMIRDENGRLTGYVSIDVAGRDLGSYIDAARAEVKKDVTVPAGYELVWSGQFEAMERVRERMKLVAPITLVLVALLLYLNTASGIKTAMILLAVPFSAIGAVWILVLLHYNVSVAVWVGLIALLGVDAETAVFMLMYLDLAYAHARAESQLTTRADLARAIESGAVERLRPKVMTVACMLFGLLPILWSSGVGADVMKRIAAPIVGGIFTSFLMELVVYPPLFFLWKWHGEMRRQFPHP